MIARWILDIQEKSLRLSEALFLLYSVLRIFCLRLQAIRLIGIRASSLVGKGKQLGLFDPGVERAQRLDRAINRIRSKYGLSSIKSGGTKPL